MLKNNALWIGLELLAAYLLIGYFVAPLLVQPRLEQFVFSQLGRELRFERLRVDPITWTVRMEAVELGAGGESLWPGLAMSAGGVDMRFNFWRLSPVISALTLREPKLVLDSGSDQLQSGRYPFIGLWRQWHQGNDTGTERQPLSVKNWQLESGQFLITQAGSPATQEVVLDDISLEAAPQNPDGLREYSLAFSAVGKVDIKSQGVYRSEDLNAKGQYQLQMAGAADGSMAELQAAGAVSGNFLADRMQIELSESQLSAGHLSTCLLDGLFCAVITPLQAGFESRLRVASDGIRVLEADARLNAFQLDASLGQGRVQFAGQQRFYGAQIELSLPPASSPDGAEEDANQRFVVWLNGTDTNQYQIGGQMDLQEQTTEAQFQINGRQRVNGTVQLRKVGAQQAQAAASQLDLQLQNPGASLAQEFMNKHFTTGLEARTLQLQLVARLDDMGLKLQENISLEGARLVPGSGQGSNANSEPESSNSLDAEWLLALLQDPDGRIGLEVPELTADSTTGTSLDELVQQRVLSMLTDLAEQPFVGLARSLRVDNQDLDEISFAPGSAALDAASTDTLTDLADILLQRPGLGISLAGVYDPLVDMKALQTEQVRTHIALAMAADLAFRTGAEPPDFSDPLVHSVIDEFARRRVPANVMQDFAAQFGHADADQGVLPEGDAATYYSSLFEVLVDYADVPQGAMATLARFRAQAVIDTLEDQGLARERLEAAGQAASSEARVDGVPLPLQLQTWSEEKVDSAPETAPVPLPEPATDTQV